VALWIAGDNWLDDFVCDRSNRVAVLLAVDFEIVGSIGAIETIARGRGIRSLAYLQKVHGRGSWRKMKGVARVRLPNG